MNKTYMGLSLLAVALSFGTLAVANDKSESGAKSIGCSAAYYEHEFSLTDKQVKMNRQPLYVNTQDYGSLGMAMDSCSAEHGTLVSVRAQKLDGLHVIEDNSWSVHSDLMLCDPGVDASKGISFLGDGAELIVLSRKGRDTNYSIKATASSGEALALFSSGPVFF